MPAKKKNTTEKAEKAAEKAVEPAAEQAEESPKKASPKKAPKSPKKGADKSVEVVPKRLVPAAGKRQPRKVERFDEPSEKKEEKEIVIKKGKGKKFEDIENIAPKIKNRPKSDELVQTLHSICFGGRATKKTDVKAHLNAFSGVVYDDDFTRKRLEDRIETRTLPVLRQVAAMLGQNPEGTKDEIVGKIADFLEKPSASDHNYRVASATKKRSRSSSRSRSPSRSDSSKSPSKKRSKSSSKSPSKSPARKKRAKKDPNAPKRGLSSYMFFCQAHRKDLPKNLKVTEQAVELAKMWKKASNSDKKKFEEKSKKDKERYEKEMKKYKPAK